MAVLVRRDDLLQRSNRLCRNAHDTRQSAKGFCDGRTRPGTRAAFAWYKASIGRALGASGLSPADQAAVTARCCGRHSASRPPPLRPRPLTSVDFKEHNGAQESLAVAATIVGEALVALGYVQQAVAAAGGGGLPAALAVVDPVLQQIERLRTLDATAAIRRLR